MLTVIAKRVLIKVFARTENQLQPADDNPNITSQDQLSVFCYQIFINRISVYQSSFSTFP